MNKYKLSQIRHQIAKWRMQQNNGKFSSASPDYQNRVRKNLAHWESQLDQRHSILERRRSK